MRKTIKHLQFKAEYYLRKVEQLSADEVQNEEIGKLVDSIVDSQDGHRQLVEIFTEADGVTAGLGDVIKEIWENDRNEWNQFKCDQETNKQVFIIPENSNF